MHRAVVASVLALFIGVLLPAAVPAPALASPQQEYDGPYFGENNFPPECTRDMSPANPENFCFHMKSISKLNPLDSPQIDVLILLPASPVAERDMRIMRQSVEMWEGGIDYLAEEMGLDWLRDGVDFHIFVDYIDLAGEGNGGEFTTYPVVDPEIVVIGANPGPGAGIGIDPFTIVNESGVPCHNLANPFDFEYWENLPGFNSHHDTRSGTFNEDCDGKGGNICFAVNGSWDPEPTTIDWWGLFNLVSHEFGHCLTLGHVGDGAEREVLGQGWGPVPADDIMSYSDDARMSYGKEPVHPSKCVSTLDVEVFAIRMSRYLDVNADGVVGPEDALSPNDLIGADGFPFQVQHPADHRYASSTGSPTDCSQPDLRLTPGMRTDWTPQPVPSVEPILEVTTPAEHTQTRERSVVIVGTVSERSLIEPPEPTSMSVTYYDDSADATGPYTEIESVTATATDSHIEAVIQLSQLWPSTTVTSPANYSLIIDGRRIDSLVRYPTDANPWTWDGWGSLPDGTSEWDTENHRVLFHIPREYLRQNAILAPYQVSATANHGTHLAVNRDDWAPEPGESIGIAAPPQQLPEPRPIGDPSQDDDRDGVPNESDRCPNQPGLTADGCTARTPTRIEVSIDGMPAGTQDVYADYGPDDFSIPVELRRGQQTIQVEWLDAGTVLASRELIVTRKPSRPDSDDGHGHGTR